MPNQVCTLDISHCNSREDIRKYVTTVFLNEVAGNGKGEQTSKYRYNVYKICDGKYVYLSRPAHLNKGFDFTVCVDDESFPAKPNSKGNITHSNKPSHYCILKDLQTKKAENKQKYERLLDIINKIYAVQPVNDDIPSFSTGYNVRMLLSIIEWLFIEQDITYWNYSGRKMLMDSINSIEE